MNAKAKESHLINGIGSKIVLPYLLLTLLVAGFGAFIFVNFLTSSLQERFNNQLVNAGRVVAERMVAHEQERLAVLRQIAFTEGVANALEAADNGTLAELVAPIMANSDLEFALLLDDQGNQVYGWQQSGSGAGTEAYVDANLRDLEDVRLVLQGYADASGDKRAFYAQMTDEPLLFTVGPVYNGRNLVGAVVVGTAIQEMMVDLTETAVARVTLYNPQGQVIATTLSDGRSDAYQLLQEPPGQYDNIRTALQESPAQYGMVIENAANNVPLRQIEILNQHYELAFGDWRLRDNSLGLFSVALPTNYIFATASNSRDVLNIIFITTTTLVIFVGFLVARRIVTPLNRLVDVTTAVTEGDLAQRTGIHRRDEIGALASSFDTMTDRLDERTQELIAQQSGLSAILNSIADGVIVLDNEYNITDANPAAEQFLSDMATGFSTGALHQLFNLDPQDDHMKVEPDSARRFELNGRILSASTAPVITPDGSRTGTVMVLRDITRFAEAESLKDDFITSMSHELRTPLTVIKVYADLLQRTSKDSVGGPQHKYVGKIQKASNELEAHIQKLISISEIQAGTLSLKTTPLTIADLVPPLVEKWQPQMEDKAIMLMVQLPDTPLPIMADVPRLVWALDNLLENACTYTPENGRVTLSVTQQDEWVSIAVADTGVGLPVADMPYIFERFFRAKNEINYTVRGIGLGLYITKEIVELHDGRIEAESKLGVGSTFTCHLPLAPISVPVEAGVR